MQALLVNDQVCSINMKAITRVFSLFKKKLEMCFISPLTFYGIDSVWILLTFKISHFKCLF